MGFSPANNPLVPEVNYTPFVCVISDISTGSTTEVTTSIDHAFVVGNLVYFNIPQEWGIQQLNGRKGLVLATTDETFTVNINSSSFNPFVTPTAPTNVVYNQPQAIPAGGLNSGTLFPGGVPVVPNTIPGSYTINGEDL